MESQDRPTRVSTEPLTIKSPEQELGTFRLWGRVQVDGSGFPDDMEVPAWPLELPWAGARLGTGGRGARGAGLGCVFNLGKTHGVNQGFAWVSALSCWC